MNLTQGRRADEFNRLLESDVRGDDPVTTPLLMVADALRELPAVDGPRPEFRAALRQRLVAVATVQGVGEPATPIQRAREAGGTWRVQRRLTALAAGAAVVTGVTGVAVGAGRALPGDPFYGVKRAAEGAQLATTVGTEARGKRHLEFARTRLHEVEALSSAASGLGPVGGSPAVAGARAEGTTHTKLIADTLHDMDVETRSGANDLFAAYRDSGSREPLEALNAFTREQYTRLQSLVAALPSADREQVRASMTLLSVVATDTVHLAGSSTSGTQTPTPGSPSAPTPSAPHPTGGTTPTVLPPHSSGPPTASTPAGQQSSGGSILPTSPSVPTPSVKVPLTPSVPVVPTIPAILPTTAPLPSDVPTLPDLSDLSGLLGQ